ncbi:MAG TPA: hypothetical protein VKR22_15585 [Acidimicrobiales bacterium]|nr:hypothetical protein [Acidimicrobiales bacterium]
MAEVRLWCRVRIEGPDGWTPALATLCGLGAPDIGAMDQLARLALTARRLGVRVVLSDVCAELAELIELAGLTGPCGLGGPAASAVEVQRQAESREQPLVVEEVEEEAHLGDAAV